MNPGIIPKNLGIAFLLALAVGMVFFPLFIRWQQQRQLGQKIKKEGPNLHLHKENTPSMGGIIIFIAIFVVYGVGRQYWHGNLLPIILLAGYTLLGLVDDWYKSYLEKPWGIKARYKFLFQVLLAGLILWLARDGIPAQITIPFSHYVIPISFPLFFGYGIFIIVATSNAFNIADGLDGLAAGSGILTLLFWGCLLLIMNQNQLSWLAFGAIGGLTAFLWFNVWPAGIFMGDSGSLGLGALIGFMALLSGQSLLIIFSALVFFIDTLSVILQVFSFRFLGRRLFLMSPIHHHFELKGMKETQITVRFWIIQAIGITVAWLGRLQ
ncbi:MAG TPA: phospho-N-acetylmuramoyl-pentapeptide-transferase [Candidatus Atribacteria bacterium]|nr:phospho-N-acetylmuramoyl-pentapeptide-transferase [Candidatus Atribacteria bacterium]HCU22438.1 phospho-N-acetylmuramoyl-pentapeptide-transferase [Candidatus Atribacteria bacterium]